MSVGIILFTVWFILLIRLSRHMLLQADKIFFPLHNIVVSQQLVWLLFTSLLGVVLLAVFTYSGMIGTRNRAKNTIGSSG